MARDGSSGVAGSLVIEIAPVSSSRHTKSENVPPVSTVTRYFPKIVLRSPAKRAGLASGLQDAMSVAHCAAPSQTRSPGRFRAGAAHCLDFILVAARMADSRRTPVGIGTQRAAWRARKGALHAFDFMA
jgi:hypothetical protein